MAGSGLRLQQQIPKQFIKINERPLFTYALDQLYHHDLIGRLVLVVHDDYRLEVSAYCQKNYPNKPFTVISGGKTRQESVYQAILYLNPLLNDDDLVLIHDAARPLVSKETIANNLKTAAVFGAVTTAITSTDTLIKVDEHLRLDKTLEREQIYRVQTPQTFAFSLLKIAHQHAAARNINSFSDDAQMVRALPHDVRIVEGDTTNFKVTNPHDLEILRALLAKGELSDE